MKLAFWRKRKKEEPAPEPPPQPLLSVCFCGGAAADSLPALPDGCEATAEGEPNGRYVLFLSEDEPLPAGLDGLLGQLAGHSEELLLFRTDAKGEPPAAEAILRQGFEPRRIWCAAALGLFRRMPEQLRGACRGERLAALLLLAESCASPDFIGGRHGGAEPGAEKATESLRQFIYFFGDAKGGLSAEKYRFAFSYACGRAVGTYAELAAENKTEELRLFDDFLKQENMALRVAAKEHSAVVRQLIRRNFRAPFWLLPLCAAAAAKDRAKR